MLSLLSIGALLSITNSIQAAAVNHHQPALRNCHSFLIPVNISTAGAIYDVQHVNNDIDAVAYAIQADTWSTPPAFQRVIENTTITGVYNINAQLCVPEANAPRAGILQLATHGLHYDGRYWDPEIDSGSGSYVNAALKAGYSILTYDRLGVGKSDKPDAYNVVQSPVHLAVLHQLTLMARDGRLYKLAAKASPSFQNVSPPSKIIHVGHSFGSVTSMAYISQYGSFSDGAIITGYIPNQYLGRGGAVSFGLRNAATYSSEYADRSSGYVIANKQGIQAVFFGGNVSTAFTQEMFDYGDKIKQPITVGEYTSAYSVALAGSGSTEFKGPLQYILAEFDFYVCGGDCKGIYSVDMLKGLFPDVPELEVYVQPNTGHAFPLHNNATAGYQVTFDFLARNGL